METTEKAVFIEPRVTDRFAICLGYYWAAVLNNGTGAAYSIFSRLAAIDYRPAPSEEFIPETMEEAIKRGLEDAYTVLLGLL